jgi:FtsP/CotA-like multicopper oxidase with cupredoxin domain
MISRRNVLISGAALGGAALLTGRDQALAADQPHEHQPSPPPAGRTARPGRAAGAPARPAAGQPGSVVTPNGASLPWKLVDGVKVFHLVAEPVVREFAPGLTVDCWGYNGLTPGPTIEANEGDRCRFYVTNKLPEETAVHWHGVFLPNGMDGVSGVTQKPIPPGQTFRYEFTFTKAGTFMYHPHFDEMTQIALGMTGMIVVHPRNRRETRRVRDYALMLHEWQIPAGTRRPNPLAMNDFNVLTFNSKAFPGTEPLVAELGDLVRIRLGNLGPMDHHPIHIHGHAFRVVETDGGPVPRAAQWPETTILVPVGAVRVIEFVADAPGDWPFHCHMTHHVMNQMGHDVPNMIGVDVSGLDQKLGKHLPGYMTMGHTGMGNMGHMGMPGPQNSIPMQGAPGPFGYIDMGGMFTLIKIRERLTGSGDPGWYQHPAGTVAEAATQDELRRDGIEIG